MIRINMAKIDRGCVDHFDLEDAVRSALMSAVEHRCRVEFLHKGRRYSVAYADLHALMRVAENKN